MRSLILGILAVAMLVPSIVRADLVGTGQVGISASVQSRVMPDTSTVGSGPNTILADGVSTSVVSIKLLDKDGQPLASLQVSCSTNRGQVDTVRAYLNGNLTDTSLVNTDANGVATFAISSYAPGEATVTCVADTVILTQKPVVTFTALSALAKLSLTIDMPKLFTGSIFPAGGVKLIQGPQETTGSTTTGTGKSLIYTGVDFRIAWWVFLLILIFAVSLPILLVMVALLYRKTRRGFDDERNYLKQERGLLERIYELEKKLAEKQINSQSGR